MDFTGITEDTICAIASAPGMGAIAVIRVSGKNTFPILEKVFSKSLENLPSHSCHLGKIVENKRVIDEVLLTLFRNPKSFTGEDVIEIACHGSTYIQKEILRVLFNAGCRMARPGEFTLRGFYNGKMDLSQAEAVGDLIHSTSETSHALAMDQMRGGFSRKIEELRKQLIHFASLIELELDFAEEDVEFANRDELRTLINTIVKTVQHLILSFDMGNAVKTGIPVAICGATNAGKSTLLNTLLQDNRAIVSDIHGTTRDTVEDEVVWSGVSFRLVDTAGIRETEDTIENIGILKSLEKASESKAVLWVVDGTKRSLQDISQELEKLKEKVKTLPAQFIVLANKMDDPNYQLPTTYQEFPDFALYPISAKQEKGVEAIQTRLVDWVKNGVLAQHDVIVTNTRHYTELSETLVYLEQTLGGMDNQVSSDFLAMDIRQALYHLGQITGAISTDDLLDNIFLNFCIGK